jgi:hypothetical protein
MISSLARLLSPAARRAARHLQPLALLTTVSVAAAIGASLVFTTPAQEHLSGAQAQYQAARQTQLRLQAGRLTLDELREVWNLLPPRKDFSSLVLAISELARQDGVDIPGMSYALQKAEDGLALKASMTFQAAGKYAGIRAFIHRLETTGPYLFIESLDASRSVQSRRVAGNLAGETDLSSDRTVVVFNVRVVTFLRPDPPRPGGPPVSEQGKET